MPTKLARPRQRIAAPASVQGSALRRIPLAQIDVPPLRIRRELGAVEDLAYSVGSIGLLHPVQVYRVRTRYRLIAGERRLEAARLLGWTEIEAMVREPSGNHLMLELVENTQRKWLTDIEEADALIRLVREMGHAAKEIAAQAGRSEAYVSKRIRVFEDLSLRQAIEREQLSVSVAEEFLALSQESREPLIAEAVEGSWDGRAVREAVRTLLEPTPATFDDGQESVVPALSSRGVEATGLSRRPGELTRSIQGLTRLLRGVRAVELNAADERALAALLQTVLRLARARPQTPGDCVPRSGGTMLDVHVSNSSANGPAADGVPRGTPIPCPGHGALNIRRIWVIAAGRPTQGGAPCADRALPSPRACALSARGRVRRPRTSWPRPPIPRQAGLADAPHRP